MGLEFKGWSLVRQFWIQKSFNASDVEHMLCMFYTMHQKTGPNRNVAIREMHIDEGNYFPVLCCECPTVDLPFMKFIVNKLQSVTTAYSSLIHDINYGHTNLCELFQIEFNKNDFVNLRTDSKHGGKKYRNQRAECT